MIKTSRSFTLIELLIVLALISLLASIIIVIIKPAIIFSKARDSQRISDLNKIDNLINLLAIQAQNNNSIFNELDYASSNVVYLSLQDSSSTCGSYLSQLPSLPSGWSYRCSATPTDITGQGWIPFPFSSNQLISLTKLPIDPVNKPPYYYSFVVGGSYELAAAMESETNKGINSKSGQDGGTSWNVYEVGTNKKLTPLALEDGGKRDKSLVGYWSFDEGTGTIAYDLSGNGNNGTLYNGPQWVDGKVGKALSFDGVDDYVNTSFDWSFNTRQSTTIIFWFLQRDSINYRPIIGKPSWSGWEWSIFGRGGNKLHTVYWYISGCCHTIDLSTAYTYNLNNFHHFALVYDNRIGTNGKVQYYLNGNTEASQILSSSDFQNRTNGITIGTAYTWGTYYFNGIIDEVRIYNRALSPDEIKAIYESTK